MLAEAENDITDLKARAFSGARKADVRSHQRPRRSLENGAFLFQDGDTRAQVYRVESGAICHYMVWDDGRHEVIEFAFPGDIIGFGHLETHISNAQAMVDTTVSILSPAEFQVEIDRNAELATRRTAAADREFDLLRARTVKLASREPVSRLAAFLLAISEQGASEGWDRRIIPDSFACGAAASLLNLDLETLGSALVHLEKKGLLQRDAAGLRLLDIDGLKALTRRH